MNHNEAFLGSDRRKTHVLGRCRVSPLAQCREVAGAESRRCSISADPHDRVAARELPAPRERMVRVSLLVSLAGERQHPALKGQLPLSVSLAPWERRSITHGATVSQGSPVLARSCVSSSWKSSLDCAPSVPLLPPHPPPPVLWAQHECRPHEMPTGTADSLSLTWWHRRLASPAPQGPGRPGKC